MGEREAIELLKKKGMTQSEAEGFVVGVKRGLKDIEEGKVESLSEVYAELTKHCPECGKE